MRLQAAHTRPQARRENFDFVAERKSAARECSGDDGSEAGEGEDAVNGEARPPEVGTGGTGREKRLEGVFELGQTLAAAGGDREEGRAVEHSSAHCRRNVGGDEFCPLSLHQIRFGQRDDSGGDLQKVEDGEVLARLRHHALVRGDDEQRRLNAPHACEHVLDEVAVAGHVNHADGCAIGQREPREAEVNRHLAFAFFFEAVRVDAGQRFDEGGLAVIYVAGGADNVHAGL
jgi:hypothetical protein